MVVASFKDWRKKKYPIDVRDMYKTSLDDDTSTDEHEGQDVIEPNISVKQAFDPKDLFKKKRKK